MKFLVKLFLLICLILALSIAYYAGGLHALLIVGFSL